MFDRTIIILLTFEMENLFSLKISHLQFWHIFNQKRYFHGGELI